MNLQSRRPTLEQAFNECVELLLAGRPLDAYLRAHPEYTSDLVSLLDPVDAVRMRRAVPARSPQVAAMSRQRFLDAVRDLTAERASPGIVELLVGWWSAFIRSFSGPGKVRYATVAALLLVALLGFSATRVVTVSATALPGEPLYPVKLVSEQVQLLLARDGAARRITEEAITARRVQEARAIIQLRRAVASFGIAGTLEAFTETEWQVSGLPIQINSQTRIYGAPEIGARVRGNVQAPGDGTLVGLSLTVLPGPGAADALVEPPTPTETPPASNAEPSTLRATPSPPEPLGTATRALLAVATETFVPTETPPPSPTATRTRTPTFVPIPTPTAGPSPTPLRTVQPARKYGNLISKQGNLWEIRDVDTTLKFLVDGNTIIENDPQIGNYLEAVLMLKDGVYLASKVSAIGKPEATPEPMDWLGLIENINGEWWTVNHITFRVWSETEVEGDPGIDRQAEVHAARHANGEIWARKVIVRDTSPVEFTEFIQIVGRNWLQVGRYHVLIDNQTVLLGEPPVVGRLADVQGVDLKDGRVIARVISVQPSTPTPAPSLSPTRRPTRTPTPSPSPMPPATNTPTLPVTPSNTPTLPLTETPMPTPTDTPAPTAAPATATSTATAGLAAR